MGAHANEHSPPVPVVPLFPSLAAENLQRCAVGAVSVGTAADTY